MRLPAPATARAAAPSPRSAAVASAEALPHRRRCRQRDRVGGDRELKACRAGRTDGNCSDRSRPPGTGSAVRSARRRRKAGRGGRRELGTVEAGAEQPDRHLQPFAGHRAHGLSGLAGVRLQLERRAGTGRRCRRDCGAARAWSGRCRRTPETESMRPGRATQGAELFGDNQRCVVGQHDAAGTRRGCAGWRRTMWPITTAVAALAIPVMLWCSASQ